MLQFNKKERTVTVLRVDGAQLGIEADDARTFFFMQKFGQFAKYVRKVAANCGCEAQVVQVPRGVMAYELVSPRREVKLR